MNNKKYLLIDLFYITTVLIIVYLVVDFKFGQYLFTGDFRFHIHKELIGDQFLHLISNKFSNNNFVFLSFYPLYFFLQFIPYHYILLYIFFGIPVLLFLSVKYVLARVISFQYNNVPLYVFISSLAFYFAINPSLFNRFGHWPILHGTSFLPIYVYVLYRYLQGNSYFTKFFWLLPVILYLGAMTPQLVVGYFASTTLVYALVYFADPKSIRRHVTQGLLLALGALVTFSHILYPILIGYGQTKSHLESATTSNILSSLARNSNVISAISGTNYYYGLIQFPTQLSTGFLIFMLALFFFTIQKKSNKPSTFLLLLSLFSLVIVTGYNSFSFSFDLLNQTFLSNFMWLVKDPNMYYLFFLLTVILLLARLVSSAQTRIRKLHLVIIAFSLVFSNIIFTFSWDRKDFNMFYEFVDVPQEYFILAESLKDDPGRNLWLPANIYVNKTFANEVTYFPSPSLWLTRNKELTRSTPKYNALIDVIEYEIFDNGCKNVNFLNWIIAAQKLNIIIDRNSTDNLLLEDYSIEPEIKVSQVCMYRLPNIYRYETIGNIDIYKSNLKLQEGLYRFRGSTTGLDAFLKNNPVDVIYEKAETNRIDQINLPYTVLNESFDENWLDTDDISPGYEVNMASMLFEGKDETFHYRGEFGFQKVVVIQRILLTFFLLVFIYNSLTDHVRKKYL